MLIKFVCLLENKNCQNKEITKVKTEINEMENRKTIESIKPKIGS